MADYFEPMIFMCTPEYSNPLPVIVRNAPGPIILCSEESIFPYIKSIMLLYPGCKTGKSFNPS